MRLDPLPDPATLNTFYPQGYWYVAGSDAAGWLEEAYRTIVLGDHVRFVRRALRDTDPAGLVMDVGCGGGLFLRLLKRDRMLGLDSQAQAAKVAWHRNGVPAVCATLENAPLAPGSCTAITMFHVLEHLYDPAGYLRRAHELLSADGRLIIQVPNASSWQCLLFGEHWNGLDVPRHLTDFRQRDIEAFLDRCGFEVLSRKHFSLRDNPAGLATSIAPSLDPMARRMREKAESGFQRLAKDLLYFCLVMASVPFAMLEALCRAGSSIMIEARPKRVR